MIDVLASSRHTAASLLPQLMLVLPGYLPTIAVFPVLVGPLQTLLALLPAILVGVGSMLFAAFKPGGFVKLLRFCWRQKLFLGFVATVVVGWQYLEPLRLLRGHSIASRTLEIGTDWDSDRGSAVRWGRGPGIDDATAPGIVWTNMRDKTILSSPAVTGDRVIISTATDIGPFSPEGRGAIVCLDVHSGQEIWRHAPANYRATFSSPVVSGNVVVCGEGLHQVDDARLTCLDLQTGEKRWEFRTKSHVEATAAIAEGRVFIGAGSDGFYCLSIDPDPQGQPQVLWHLEATEFADCESSPAVHDGVVYFGLGEGGTAICAVAAATGKLLWKIDTPYPVFAAPTISNGKLFIATGNGNMVQSAADLLAMKIQVLQDDGATEQQLAEARERLKPVGEVWCLDLATRTVDWKFQTGDAILGAIACGDSSERSTADDAIYFGSRDGHLYRVSLKGELLSKYDMHEPLISSPALGWKHVYCSTATGRLFCLDRTTLKPVWDSSLGPGVTFSSSPTLAHGHIYIGTAQQGLRCVGQPGEPPPPAWTRGEAGGSADDIAVPGIAEVLWQYPQPDDAQFLVTAPLMALDGAIYAGGKRQGRSEFIKLNVHATEPQQRQVWSWSCDGPIEVAPVGCGDRLYVVEGAVESSILKLHSLAAGSGQPLWSLTIAAPNAMTRRSKSTASRAGMTLDSRRLYVWTGNDQLGCFDLTTGKTLWDHSAVGSGSTASRGGWGCGTPVVSNDLLFAIAEPADDEDLTIDTKSTLSAYDAETGRVLWQVRVPGSPRSQLTVDGQQIIIEYKDQVAVQSIIDGTLLRTTSKSDSPPAISLATAEHGTAIVSPVSLQGRGYVATDRGRIVCVGAPQP